MAIIFVVYRRNFDSLEHGDAGHMRDTCTAGFHGDAGHIPNYFDNDEITGFLKITAYSDHYGPNSGEVNDQLNYFHGLARGVNQGG